MSRPRPPDRPTQGARRGLQNERTYLAWQRTGLSFAGVGALLLHMAVTNHRPMAYLPAIVGLLIGAVVLGAAILRYRNIGTATAGRAAGPAPFIGLAAVGSTVLAVCSLLLVLTA